MTVGELLASISSRELTEWQALYKVESEEQERHQKEAERKAKQGKGARRPAMGRRRR